jgi:hypothetical protein
MAACRDGWRVRPDKRLKLAGYETRRTSKVRTMNPMCAGMATLTLLLSLEAPRQQTPTKPILHVRSILSASVDSIDQALSRELGGSPVIKRVETHSDTMVTANTPASEVQVTIFHHRVIDVQVHFHAPVRNRAVALALIGLQPTTKAPSINPPGGPRWDKAFPGIDEVQGAYQPLYGPGVVQLAVTPNKVLYDHWLECAEPRMPGVKC